MVYIVRMKITDNGSECAHAYNSLEEAQRAVRKIKEGIRGSEINVRWSNNYIITVNNVEICTIDILSRDKKDVEFHLIKYVDNEWQETRRFSSRENAVNFVHRVLDINDCQADPGEDENGIWAFQYRSGTKVKYGVFLAIYKNTKKTVKANEYSEILGVNPGASDEEIKRVYRQKSKIHHPDMGGNMHDFLRIQEAYENLINGLGEANKETLHRELSDFYKCVDFEQGMNYIHSHNTDKDSNYNPGSDFLKGFIMFAVGGGLSLATYSAAHSRGGGTYTVYTGLIFYGLFKILRSIFWGVLGDKKAKIKSFIHNLIIYGGITTIILLIIIGFFAIIFSISK